MAETEGSGGGDALFVVPPYLAGLVHVADELVDLHSSQHASGSGLAELIAYVLLELVRQALNILAGHGVQSGIWRRRSWFGDGNNFKFARYEPRWYEPGGMECVKTILSEVSSPFPLTISQIPQALFKHVHEPCRTLFPPILSDKTVLVCLTRATLWRALRAPPNGDGSQYDAP